VGHEPAVGHALAAAGNGHEPAPGHQPAISHPPSASAHAEAPAGAAKEAKGAHDFDPQDMRNMGGLWGRLPVTKWVFLIGALALAGIVPLSGFWSKDEILLEAQHENLLIYLLLSVTAFLTAFYVGRQILMVFFGQPRTEPARRAVESPPIMTIPLVVLAVLAALGGALNLPRIAGWTPPGAHAFGHWLDYTLHAPAVAEEEVAAGTEGEGAAEGEHAEAAAEEVAALDFGVAGLSTGLALVALAGAYALYRARPATVDERDPLDRAAAPVFSFLSHKWYVDELYHLLIIRPFNWLGDTLANVVDGRFWHDWFHESVIAGLFNSLSRFTAGFVDASLVDGMISGMPAFFARSVARGFRRFQSGYVRNYALMVFAGVVLVLGYLLLTRVR
jgi:NADH-quinone oxidoreductase subunit L